MEKIRDFQVKIHKLFLQKKCTTIVVEYCNKTFTKQILNIGDSNLNQFREETFFHVMISCSIGAVQQKVDKKR